MMHKILLIILIAFVLSLSSNVYAQRVPVVHTPIGTLELAAVLRDGHHAAFGHFPTNNRLGVAWAQVALENGQGRWVWNHNLGMVTSKKDRPYYVRKHRFRAHATFADGAEDYWKMVDWLCPQAFRYFDEGKPYAAAMVLRRCNYYQANKFQYGRAMISLYKKARLEILPRL